VTITYRTDNGPLDVEHDIEEIEDLHDIVERGPHWDTVIEIRIVRDVPIQGPLTVEGSERL
jgi:hypothetical protein